MLSAQSAETIQGLRRTPSSVLGSSRHKLQDSDFGKILFGELSADFYHSVQNDWDMDRISFFPSAAVGARMFSGRLISPYIQAGGGPEFTRIELAGKTESRTLPTGFMGIGGELNIKQFHLGTNLRFFSMGLPEYEAPSDRKPESYYYPNNSSEPAEGPMRIRNEVAAQMQFTARYTF